MALVTAKGVLLNRYYDRRAQSMIAGTPFFKLHQVQFGEGFLDYGSTPPLVGDIPSDATKDDITNVYVDMKPTFTYDPVSHQVRVRAEIPVSAAGIPAGGASVNVGCILDEQGQAVAMLASQPVVVNSERGYVITGVLEANLS